MTYRRCTIIGMNNISAVVKESSCVILCLAIALGIRLFFIISGQMAVTDDFGYYQASVIQAEEEEPVMTSGNAFAYTENLSDILKFTGNRMEIIAGYHLFLQAAAFLFLFLGCRWFFGRTAAFLEMVVFSFSPWMVVSIFKVSSESWYLSVWSLVFMMLGLFYKKTKDDGWYRNNRGEVYLMITGFFMGIICIWHHLGFLLLFFIIYAAVKNEPELDERRKNQLAAIEMERLIKGEDWEPDEREEIMPVSSQLFILISGMFVGGYCTLMKYTGITGNFIKEQLEWWFLQLYRFENGRWQDMELWLVIGLPAVLLAGAVLQTIVNKYSRWKKLASAAESPEVKDEDAPEEKKETEKRKKDMNEKEEREIKYIKNPLPLPKKHVKKVLDFKLSEKIDDFDFEVDKNDDFDIR